MQNYNSNMDSDYTDLYSQYTKMHSNNVELDSNNGVLHYQTNELKAMPLQPDLQTNPVEQSYGNIQLKSEAAIPTHNSPDISTDLSLCYESEMSNVLTQNTQLDSAIQPKPNITMDVGLSQAVSEDQSDQPAIPSVSKPEADFSEEIPAESEKSNINEEPTKPASPGKVEEETKTVTVPPSEKEKVSDEPTEPDARNVCRVCMGDGVLISIFNSEKTVQMCEKVMSCAAVQVSLNDGLPEFICQSCVDDLEVAFNFKSRCEKSDSAFREKLGLKKKTIVKTEFVLIDCDNEPIVSDDNKKFRSDYSDPESDDPSYGAKRRRRRKKTKKLTLKIKKGKKMKMEIVKKSNDSDDDVILVTKRKKRGSILGKYPCTHCEKTFPYPSVLKLHMVSHTKEKTHKCSICTETFMYSKDLYTHYKDAHPAEYVKTENKTFPCKSCDKVFSQLKNLKVHEAVHGREKKYKCEACSQGFTNMTNLNLHKKQDHPALSKPYRCKICDKRFKQEKSLDRHMDNHKQHAVIARAVEEKKPTSTKDLFKSIAPVTTTYWSDSFSD